MWDLGNDIAVARRILVRYVVVSFFVIRKQNIPSCEHGDENVVLIPYQLQIFFLASHVGVCESSTIS
jgi:hypothetical protein